MDEPAQSLQPSGEEAVFRLMLAGIAGMVMWRTCQDSALTLAAAELVWWIVGSVTPS